MNDKQEQFLFLGIERPLVNDLFSFSRMNVYFDLDYVVSYISSMNNNKNSDTDSNTSSETNSDTNTKTGNNIYNRIDAIFDIIKKKGDLLYDLSLQMHRNKIDPSLTKYIDEKIKQQGQKISLLNNLRDVDDIEKYDYIKDFHFIFFRLFSTKTEDQCYRQIYSTYKNIVKKHGLHTEITIFLDSITDVLSYVYSDIIYMKQNNGNSIFLDFYQVHYRNRYVQQRELYYEIFNGLPMYNNDFKYNDIDIKEVFQWFYQNYVTDKKGYVLDRFLYSFVLNCIVYQIEDIDEIMEKTIGIQISLEICKHIKIKASQSNIQLEYFDFPCFSPHYEEIAKYMQQQNVDYKQKQQFLFNLIKIIDRKIDKGLMDQKSLQRIRNCYDILQMDSGDNAKSLDYYLCQYSEHFNHKITKECDVNQLPQKKLAKFFEESQLILQKQEIQGVSEKILQQQRDGIFSMFQRQFQKGNKEIVFDLIDKYKYYLRFSLDDVKNCFQSPFRIQILDMLTDFLKVKGYKQFNESFVGFNIVYLLQYALQETGGRQYLYIYRQIYENIKILPQKLYKTLIILLILMEDKIPEEQLEFILDTCMPKIKEDLQENETEMQNFYTNIFRQSYRLKKFDIFMYYNKEMIKYKDVPNIQSLFYNFIDFVTKDGTKENDLIIYNFNQKYFFEILQNLFQMDQNQFIKRTQHVISQQKSVIMEKLLCIIGTHQFQHLYKRNHDRLKKYFLYNVKI